MSCSIKINNECSILYYKHYGTIEKNNLIESWEKVLVYWRNKDMDTIYY